MLSRVEKDYALKYNGSPKAYTLIMQSPAFKTRFPTVALARVYHMKTNSSFNTKFKYKISYDSKEASSHKTISAIVQWLHQLLIITFV